MAKKEWMQGVKKKIEKRGTEGSFTRWCKSRGYEGVTAECIEKGLNSDSKSIQAKAKLAKAFGSVGARKTKRTKKSRRK